MNIAFIYQVGFSGNGGIERFNRCFMKALDEILSLQKKNTFRAYSLYDTVTDPKYLSAPKMRGFAGNKILMAIHVFMSAWSKNVLIFGHVNLYLIFQWIHFFMPSKKSVLIVHGIDVWYLTHSGKIHFLKNVDYILSVSHFTKNKIVNDHNLDESKIYVLWNTLDPTYNFSTDFSKPDRLLEKYRIGINSTVILTITRLNEKEWHKGYDQVLRAIAKLKTKDVVYLLGGAYSSNEKLRLDALIAQLGLVDRVYLTGYIAEDEILDYYSLADIYIMPSKKEGFGIVFIEALANGLLTIGGKTDGSAEALGMGALGKLVNPDSVEAIAEVLEQAIENPLRIETKRALQKTALSIYGFETYKSRLKEIIWNLMKLE